MSDFRLKVFYSVATHQSFTKAAAELFITQPAVTKNIQALETTFDMRLFDRRGNKIILTSAGQTLLNYTEQILDIYKQIDFEFSVIKKKFSGQLQLGASTTIGQYVLPSVLAKFYKAFPEVKLFLLNDNTEKIEKALLDKRIELGIVEGRTKSKQFKYIPFLKDEIVAIAHANQPLAKEDEISLRELKKVPLVFRERGSGSLEVIEHEFAQHKINLSAMNIAMYLGSTESIKSFLANSNCLGFVSISAVLKEITNGDFKIIDIKNLDIKRTFYFVHLLGNPDGLADTFMRFALKQYNQK